MEITLDQLKNIAKRDRKDIVMMLTESASGHPVVRYQQLKF